MYKPSTKQFVFLNVTGVRNINPGDPEWNGADAGGTGGDSSRQLLNTTSGVTSGQLYDPTTGLPFLNNKLKNATTPISPQAQALLNFYPAPNVPGTGLRNNYQTITNAGQNSTSAALRFVRNFGQNNADWRGRRQAANAPKTLRQNINFNGAIRTQRADNRNIFLPLGGATRRMGMVMTAGYTIGYGRLTNNASMNWNRSHASSGITSPNGNSDPLDGTGIRDSEAGDWSGTGNLLGVPA